MSEDCVPGELVLESEYDPHEFEDFNAPSLPTDLTLWEIVLKVVFYVIAFLLDVFGNSIVVLIIITNKRMRTPTNVLILNLAVSDLMVAACCMWVHLGNRITTEWPFGPFVCKVNTFMQVVAVSSSVLTLTAISVERFFAIVYPLMPRMPPWLTGLIVTANWILSIAIAAPHLFVRVQYEYYWADRHQVWCDENWPKIYTDTECHTKSPGKTVYYTLEGVVMYFVPIVVMMVAYSLILVKMVRRKFPGSTVRSTTTTAQDRSKRKVIRMLIVVLAVFVVCWTPQQVLIIWDIYRPKDTMVPQYLQTVKYIAVYTAYLNSAINPVIYGGFNENFRKGFKDAFKCYLWKRRNAVIPVTSGRNNQGSNTTAVGGSLI